MNVREAVLLVLNDVHNNGAYANVALDRVLARVELSEMDRRLATEIVYGSVKAGDSLDWMIRQYIKIPWRKVAPVVKNILRLSCYQLFFMDRIPASAACNQGVELVKKYGHSGTVKFVNAVLRSASRAPDKADCKNAKLSEAERTALSYQHPLWLVQHWQSTLGGDATQKLCEFNNQPPPLSLRANTLKTSRDELLNVLQDEGAVCRPSRWTPEGILCGEHPALHRWPSLIAGLWQVQDESSMLTAHILAPQPGELIIDTCSAPGGKATHIAALMRNQGRVVAIDIYEHKLKKITENASRLGIDIIQTELLDARLAGERYGGQADRVLVDAPCSGLGVLRRKSDSRWRKDAAQLDQLPKLQLEILTSGAAAVKPGGVLVYSTCTIERAENEAVVEEFLRRRSDFFLDDAAAFLPNGGKNGPMINLLPHIDGVDGFFIARLIRNK